jgi:hypothetical protein
VCVPLRTAAAVEAVQKPKTRKVTPMSKMNALAVSQDENARGAVAVAGTVDVFEAYANAVAPKNIIGTLLKFSKGDYLAGEENKSIETGTTVTANLDELLAGWIRWKEGKAD